MRDTHRTPWAAMLAGAILATAATPAFAGKVNVKPVAAAKMTPQQAAAALHIRRLSDSEARKLLSSARPL